MIVSDSVRDRMLPWLSLFGDGRLTLAGETLTKSQKRLPLRVTSSFFRRFECVEGCYVCCARLGISLDYLEGESAWLRMPKEFKSLFTPRTIEVNQGQYTVWTHEKQGYRDNAKRETDADRLKHFCTFLASVRPNGGPGCSLWQTGSPLGCASAYNMHVHERPEAVFVTKRGLGRAWAYDPEPECLFYDTDIAEADLETNVNLLQRFLEWAMIFNYEPAMNRIDELLFGITRVIDSERNPGIIIVE